MITLVALLVSIFSLFMYVPFDATLAGEFPQYYFYIGAFCVFVY